MNKEIGMQTTRASLSWPGVQARQVGSFITAIAVLAAIAAVRLAAQGPAAKSGYPVPPRSLGEAEELALALTAAPDEISSGADVYVLRGTDFVKVRTGTNGCACMVGRDLHEASRYPICFDREGAKTSLWREIKEGSLRAKGMSEAEVVRAVDAAYASGELKMSDKPTLAYMMSPKQLLFSSPFADGFRVGAWSPHIMIMTSPSFSPEQLGMRAKDSKVDAISIRVEGNRHAELTVKVPTWSNGKPVARDDKP
jgi:hypothetical protein